MKLFFKKIYKSEIVSIIPICFLIIAIIYTSNFIKTKEGNLIIIPKKNRVEVTIKSTEQVKNDFNLIIPKLNIEAPVTKNVNGTDESEYIEYLKNGVAHLKNTSLPDENGNVFIFGHSADLATRSGDYKEIFKYLDQLDNKDELYLQYNGIEYIYHVIEKSIIESSDVSVVHNKNKKNTLTLMTCWPPGTLENRFVVVAEKESQKLSTKHNEN